MSTPPKDPNRKRVTLTKLAEMRALGEPIVMITAYDHPSALVVEEAGVDVVLVGDSAANNVLGYTDTTTRVGLVYYYKVKAVNSYGTSGYSNEAHTKAV